MSIKASAKIELFEPRRIETCKKHLVDNQHIYRLTLLELFDIGLSLKFVAFVVQYKRSTERLLGRAI